MTSCLTAGLFFMLPLSTLANPSLGKISAGQATISQLGKKLIVNQTSDKAVIDWRGFDIAPGETTQFIQPSRSSIMLNRVNNNSISHIDGNLTATGNIIIVNQNGVIFGTGAIVDVNGLIATTADIDNNVFMNSTSKLAFNKPGDPSAAIVNNGQITAKDAGLVGFVAPNVVNNGVISAKLGRVHLASGDTATVDMYGDGLLQVAVSDKVTSLLVSNEAVIEADGGTIALTAVAGKEMVNSLITVAGELRAPSIAEKNGKIIIAAEGSNAVTDNVTANKGKKSGSSTVLISGMLAARGQNPGEHGGKITVIGDNVALLHGTVIDASGSDGLSNTTAGQVKSAYRPGAAGGDIRIGGDYLGGGDTPTAKNLYVDSGVLVLNDALKSGDAGRTIFWSDNKTQFYGNVYARALGGKPVDALTWNATAGGNSGDGGFVETSGHGTLDAGGYVNLTASNGKRGTYFLDPTNITVYGNVDPTFQSTDGTINLGANLKLWLDASDTTKVNLSYNSLGTTATGTSGQNTITVSANTNLVVGARIRLGGAGSVTAASTLGADTYTISNISGTTITLSSNLTSSYAGSSVYEGYISQMTDKSGQGNNATQATAANRPLWISNGKNGIGDAYYNGSSSQLLLTVAGYSGGNQYQVFSILDYTKAATFNNYQAAFVSNIDGSENKVAGNSGGTSFLTAFGGAVSYINGASGSDGSPLSTLKIVATSATTLPAAGQSIGSNPHYAGRNWQGDLPEFVMYLNALPTDSQALLNQYESAKWGIALTPPGTGATEVAKATASNGYSVFTTRYLERLSSSADISLQATNNIVLDLKGDTLAPAAGRNLSLTAGNNISNVSSGTITTTQSGGSGGNITLTTSNSGTINLDNTFILNAGGALSMTTAGGGITLAHALTVGSGGFSSNSGSGTTTFSSTVDGANNFSATAGSFSFASALGGTTPLAAVSLTSTNSLTMPSINATSIVTQTTGANSDITIPSGKVLTVSGTGTALTLASSHNFINSEGSDALSLTGGGSPRWLIYSTNPANDTIGSLSNSFRRFTCAYGGACPSLGSGNGLLYSYTPTLTVTPSALSLTYGDAVPASYSYNALTVDQYLSAADFAADSISGLLNCCTSYTQGSNIGSYNINGSGSLSSALGYGFSYASNPTAITVVTRPITIAANPLSTTYGNTIPTLTYNVISGSLYGADSFSGALTTAHGGAGTVLKHANGFDVSGSPFAITQGTLSNSNYAITYNSANLTLAAKGISITGFAAASKTYDGSISASITSDGSLSGAVAGDDISINNVSSSASFDNKHAGTTHIVNASGYTLSGAQAGNYSLSQQPTASNVTISQKPLTVTADSVNSIYGNTLAVFTYSTSGLLGSDSLDGALTTANSGGGTVLSHANGFDVSGSPFAITQGTLSNSDYAITYNSAKLTLAAKGISITGFAAASKIYDGGISASITNDGSLSGAVAGDDININNAGASASFDNKHASTAHTVTASGYALSGAQAGNYSLSQPTASNVTISQKPLTVTADSVNSIYGNTLAVFTYSTSGLLGSDSLDGALTTANSGGGTVLSHANGFDVSGSPFAITQGTLSNSDYAITYKGAKLTLAARGLSVTADNKSITYGDTEPMLTFSYTGLATGDNSANFIGSLARASGNSVGNYGIEQNTLAAIGNYTIDSYNPGVFTIDTAMLPNTVVRVSLDPTLNMFNKSNVGSSIIQNAPTFPWESQPSTNTTATSDNARELSSHNADTIYSSSTTNDITDSDDKKNDTGYKSSSQQGKTQYGWLKIDPVLTKRLDLNAQHMMLIGVQ